MAALSGLRYAAARALALPHVLRRYHRGHALVLCYHAVVSEEASPPRWTEVTRARFRAQMRFLRARYRILPLLDLVESLRRGDSLPAYAAAVTFDDGYRNNFTCAFPVLRELGIPATIFLTTGFLDDGRPLWTDRLTLALEHTPVAEVETSKRVLPLRTPTERREARATLAADLKALPSAEKCRQLDALERRLGVSALAAPAAMQPLGWDEVRTMHASGLVSFGSHTVTHEIVTRLSTAAKAREITYSVRRVQEETGQPCRLFAYPNGEMGDFDDESRRLLAATSVVGAVTTVPGLVARTADVWELPRVLVGADAGRAKFDLLSSGLLAAVSHRQTARQMEPYGAA
jgi:peptidoglycan/xylan/chitin deacetylase (PgdA/CDA1 family)